MKEIKSNSRQLSLSRKSILTLACIMALIISSCQKEDNENINFQENSKRSALLIRQINQKGYNEYAALSDEEFKRIALPIREQLVKNRVLTVLKTGDEEIPLEAIFYLYEGVINSVSTIIAPPQDNYELFESTLTLPVLQQGENFFVEIEDFNAFYTNAINQMNQEVSAAENEYLSLADFTLVALSPTTATVNLKFVVSTPAQQLFLPNPGGEVHAAELMGYCANSTASTFDLATFLNGHANSQGELYTNIAPCPPSFPTKIRISYGAYDTYQTPNPLGVSASLIAANIWGNTTNTLNECIGDDFDPSNNTQIWNSWYQKTDNLINAGLNSVTVNFPNAKFLNAQFSSVTNNSQNPPTLYHYGLFWYGRVMCI